MRWNEYRISGMKLSRFFSPFLIPASSIGTEKQLSAAPIRAVHVPVISCSRSKAHMENIHLPKAERCKIGLSDKILLIRRILLPHGKRCQSFRHCRNAFPSAVRVLIRNSIMFRDGGSFFRNRRFLFINLFY